MWRKSWWHHRWGRYGWSIAWVERAAIRVFKGVGFDLRTWNANVPELEADKQLTDDSQTYAKEQLEVKPNAAKLLGLPWEKVGDTLAVTFFGWFKRSHKKRSAKELCFSIWPPWGSKSCNLDRGWCAEKHVADTALGILFYPKNWNHKGNWPGELKFPRSLTIAQEPVQKLHLHAFCDSSGKGTVAAAVYAVVHQESGTKKGLTIPRLELISAQMAANLVDNVRSALEGCVASGVLAEGTKLAF